MLIKHLQQFEQDNLKQLDFLSVFLNKHLSILPWPCYSPFSQLIRQSLLTLSERRAGHFLFVMSPENSLSHGTVVAGVARYLQGSSASLSWAPEWADHRSSGQSCSVQVHDSVCKTRFLIFTSLLRIVHAAVLPNVVHVPLSVTLGKALQVLASKIQSCCFRTQHPESMLPVVKTHTKVKMVEEQNSY